MRRSDECGAEHVCSNSIFYRHHWHAGQMKVRDPALLQDSRHWQPVWWQHPRHQYLIYHYDGNDLASCELNGLGLWRNQCQTILKSWTLLIQQALQTSDVYIVNLPLFNGCGIGRRQCQEHWKEAWSAGCRAAKAERCEWERWERVEASTAASAAGQRRAVKEWGWRVCFAQWPAHGWVSSPVVNEVWQLKSVYVARKHSCVAPWICSVPSLLE